MNIQNYFAVTAEQQELVQWIGEIADRYADGAVEADEQNHLNAELIQALKDAEYHTFSVPQEYGGKGISLTFADLGFIYSIGYKFSKNIFYIKIYFVCYNLLQTKCIRLH